MIFHLHNFQTIYMILHIAEILQLLFQKQVIFFKTICLLFKRYNQCIKEYLLLIIFRYLRLASQNENSSFLFHLFHLSTNPQIFIFFSMEFFIFCTFSLSNFSLSFFSYKQIISSYCKSFHNTRKFRLNIFLLYIYRFCYKFIFCPSLSSHLSIPQDKGDPKISPCLENQ